MTEPTVADVEHAEGNDLLRHYLTKAGRALATARAVNPTR